MSAENIYTKVFRDKMSRMQNVKDLSWQQKAMVAGADTYSDLSRSAMENGNLTEAIEWNGKFQRVNGKGTTQEAYDIMMNYTGRLIRLGAKI